MCNIIYKYKRYYSGSVILYRYVSIFCIYVCMWVCVWRLCVSNCCNRIFSLSFSIKDIFSVPFCRAYLSNNMYTYIFIGTRFPLKEKKWLRRYSPGARWRQWRRIRLTSCWRLNRNYYYIIVCASHRRWR